MLDPIGYELLLLSFIVYVFYFYFSHLFSEDFILAFACVLRLCLLFHFLIKLLMSKKIEDRNLFSDTYKIIDLIIFEFLWLFYIYIKNYKL